MKEVKKFINLSFILDLQNYSSSFNKWIKYKQQLKPNQKEFSDFDNYLGVVKPIIHRFGFAVRELSAESFGFSTCLNEGQISKILNLFDGLGKYQIISIDKHPHCNLIPDQQALKLFPKPITNLFRMELTQFPNNLEFAFWSKTAQVQHLSITAKVIHGKGLGAKQLGMPTANFPVDHQLEISLCDYPFGIYAVTFQFLGGARYQGVASLGTNPHYENLQSGRVMEVYVFHDFGETTFYGAEVQVTILELIRLEGKFETYDAFLNAMQNDIFVAKSIKP